jgi:hypothetical protein
MKKWITLLCCLGLFSGAAFAQAGSRERAADIILNGKRGANGSSQTAPVILLPDGSTTTTTNTRRVKAKGNRGNHYGWQKGVGNPHRDANFTNNGQRGKGRKGKGR